MNETLKNIFETYEKEKNKIRRKLDANKETIDSLNNELDSIIKKYDTIMERINARKENKFVIAELEKKLAAAYETETTLKTALQVANEMKVKVVANALRLEIIENSEKWSKYPLHYQKSKDMVKDFLSGTDLYLVNSYNIGSYYITGSYDYHNINGYVFHTTSGIITKEVVEEMKNKQKYPIIKAADILTECKKAFTARKKILAKYESMKKELDALRTPFSSIGTFYNILPYANSTPENYKRL